MFTWNLASFLYTHTYTSPSINTEIKKMVSYFFFFFAKGIKVEMGHCVAVLYPPKHTVLLDKTLTINHVMTLTGINFIKFMTL